LPELRNGRERLLRTSYFRRKRRFKEKTKLREAEDRYRLGKSQ
jgi:hypothetical protein